MHLRGQWLTVQCPKKKKKALPTSPLVYGRGEWAFLTYISRNATQGHIFFDLQEIK